MLEFPRAKSCIYCLRLISLFVYKTKILCVSLLFLFIFIFLLPNHFRLKSYKRSHAHYTYGTKLNHIQKYNRAILHSLGSFGFSQVSQPAKI